MNKSTILPLLNSNKVVWGINKVVWGIKLCHTTLT